MAKVITQDTFDSVVQENMEEFEMDIEEAIADAVTQFESQGVNLLNIVRDPHIYANTGGPTKHAVIEAIGNLTTEFAAVSLDEEKIKADLRRLKSECDIDLARRVMAGKNNAYNLILDACKESVSNQAIMKELFLTFISLCTGQPDLLNNAGMEFLMEYVSKCENNYELLALACLSIRTTCIMHEQNRQDYVENGLITLMVDTLEKNKHSGEVVKEACGVLRVLTNDDDVRAVFGKAHEHAKMIVTEENALRKIMNIANEHKTDCDILGELFLTLARLSVRNEFCAEIMELGGVKLILETLSNNMKDKALVKQIMIVLKSVAGNDDVKIAIVQADGAERILTALSQHQRQARIAEYGCAALATIVLRNEENCARVMAADGADVITKVMQLHPKDAKVQKQGCMAVRNLVARTRQYAKPFLQAGAEAIVRSALTVHPNCKDEATAALRDMDCDVHLRVLWTGEGKGITSYD